MSERFDGTGDEQVEHSPEAIQASPQLDEDTLAVDPLEEGREPPEHWAEADRFGTTGSEQREGRPLDERLADERDDTQP